MNYQWSQKFKLVGCEFSMYIKLFASNIPPHYAIFGPYKCQLLKSDMKCDELATIDSKNLNW